MDPVVTMSALITIGKFIGAITAITGLIAGVYKVITWIKNKFINIDANVVALKGAMEDGFKDLSEVLKSQTTTLTAELKEQRQDFRTFYAPILMMQQQAQQKMVPVRAKRTRKKA